MEVPMKQTAIADLTPGMITAKNIYSADSRAVLPKGTVLTENIITRLENYCIYYVDVAEEKAYDLACPLMPQITERNAKKPNDDMAAQTAKTEEASGCFLGAFKRCSEHYRTALTASIARNESFSCDDLLRETLSLLTEDTGASNALDYLLNMRNTDDSVYSHCISVALMSNLLARRLGFSKEEQITATACGLYHDCGILMLPPAVMEQYGKFTNEDYNIMRTHPIEGFHLLSRYRSIPEQVRDTALTHHERCDGSGYPYGLKSDEISRFTKLVMIADIFDNIITDKTCRSSMCPLSLIKYFEDDGIQKYDVTYIIAFLEYILNSYLKYKVTLQSGMDGNVLFMNRVLFPNTFSYAQTGKDTDLQNDYYNSIMLLSNMENLSIESII